VGSLAEGAREPEIAYASARIRPFSLASSQEEGETKSVVNERLHFTSTNVHDKNNLFIYKGRTARILIHKQKRA
jgi:hypothetical protein